MRQTFPMAVTQQSRHSPIERDNQPPIRSVKMSDRLGAESAITPRKSNVPWSPLTDSAIRHNRQRRLRWQSLPSHREVNGINFANRSSMNFH